MLKKILAIAGRPGLFEIITHGAKNIIVEDLSSKKRFPIHDRDRAKLMSLGDVAMYTESGDTPLSEILDKLYVYEKGGKIDVKGLMSKGGLRAEFEAVIPDYDKDRVYETDIKKLFVWYNILIEAGKKKFTSEDEKEDVQTAAAEAQAEAAEAGELE